MDDQDAVMQMVIITREVSIMELDLVCEFPTLTC